MWLLTFIFRVSLGTVIQFFIREILRTNYNKIRARKHRYAV